MDRGLACDSLIQETKKKNKPEIFIGPEWKSTVSQCLWPLLQREEVSASPTRERLSLNPDQSILDGAFGHCPFGKNQSSPLHISMTYYP